MDQAAGAAFVALDFVSDATPQVKNRKWSFQTCSEPDGWIPAVHEGTGPDDITITAQANGFGAGIDRITVTLPPRLAPTGKLFVRLKVKVVTP